MRKLAPLLALLFLNAGFAITASIELDRSQVGLDGTVAINYSFSLSEPSLTNFSAYANGITIFNHTTLAQSFSSQYQWNVSNTPAGNYTVRFVVEAGNGETASTTKDLEVLPEAELTMVTSDTILAFSNMTSKNYNLQNTGNIPLEVSVVPTRLYSVSPLFFTLGVGRTQDIAVQVQKPYNSISASLAVTGQNRSHSSSVTLNIEIVVPQVSVNLTDVYSFTEDDFTNLHVLVENSGNIDQNFTFSISTAENVFTRYIEAGPGQQAEQNFTLPTSDSVRSVEMDYIDSDGSTSTISVQLEETGGIFDQMGGLLGDSTTRGLVITALVLFVLYMVWKVLKR